MAPHVNRSNFTLRVRTFHVKRPVFPIRNLSLDPFHVKHSMRVPALESKTTGSYIDGEYRSDG